MFFFHVATFQEIAAPPYVNVFHDWQWGQNLVQHISIAFAMERSEL